MVGAPQPQPMNRISFGPPLGPIAAGQTNALNHGQLIVDGIANGLYMKAVYEVEPEGIKAEVCEWRGLRPINGVTWVAAGNWDSVAEHLEEGLALEKGLASYEQDVDGAIPGRA